MGPTLDLIFVILVLGGLATWVVWGWVSWAHTRPNDLNFGMLFSLAGFTFASLSALLEIGSGLYAHLIGGFPFMDSRLLGIYGWGFILATLGFVCGLCGVKSKNPLRWKAPAPAVVMLLLWFGQASGE